MSLEVRRVSNRSEMRKFLRLPFRVYRNDPFWVPQLESEIRRSLNVHRNPYYRDASLALFIALRDASTVSRVAVVVNHRYQAGPGGLPALFGYFESMNDPEAVRALFHAARQWCSARGAGSMCGPFHPHHYSEIGVQITGFDSLPSFFQTHHPQYYRDLLHGCGFSIERMIHTRRNADIKEFLRQRGRVSVRENGLTLRRIRYDDLPSEFERIRQVYNDAFSDNCYFLPLSREEYAYAASSFRLITRPDLNVIVENGREPVGVLQCVLDVNPLLRGIRSGRPSPWDIGQFLIKRREIRRLIVYAVGIKKRWQRSRVHVLLYNALTDMAMGFDELETTWMSPDNPVALHAAERFGLEPDKTFGVYSSPTQPSERQRA